MSLTKAREMMDEALNLARTAAVHGEVPVGAIIVKDGVATHVNVEAGGEFKVSAAEYVLGQL